MLETTYHHLNRRYKICEALACAVFICAFAVLPLLTLKLLGPLTIMAIAASGGVPAVSLVYFLYLVGRQSLSLKGYLGFGVLTILLAGFVSTVVALMYDALSGYLEPSSISELGLSLLVGIIGYSAFGFVFCFIPGLLAAYVFGSKIRPVMRRMAGID